MTTHSSRKGSRQFRYYVCRTYQTQGAKACPGSRAPLSDIEAAVIEKVRAVGRDPEVLRETIEATRRELETRKPELLGELGALERREPELGLERQNLIDAVTRGVRSDGLYKKLAEVEVEIDRVQRRIQEVHAEIAVIEDRVLEEDDLRQAIGNFDPVWEQLFPAERARILELLIEEVRYDVREREIEVQFRPGGVRTLAAEDERKVTA